MSSGMDQAQFLRLYKLGLIPPYVVLCSLVWVLHDYFVTLEDEIKYIWSLKWNLGRIMFTWVRYYTVALLIFDVVQIHYFRIPGVPNKDLCVLIDPVTRLVGAISLWSVEIVMQIRIFALFNRSKKVLLFNGSLFMVSIAAFLWIMVLNMKARLAMIAPIVRLPVPGCPAVNGGAQWALWIPATVFELVLFGLALYRGSISIAVHLKLNGRMSLTAFLIQDNVLYFFGISCLLVFNNLMTLGATRIPWFSFGPFHATLGIMTCRMMIHLRKFSLSDLEGTTTKTPIHFDLENSEPGPSNVSRERTTDC